MRSPSGSGSLNRYLLVYLFSLLALSTGAWQSSLAWLVPLSNLVLLLGVLWLWRREGRAFNHLGFQRGKSWNKHLGSGLAIGFGLLMLLIVVQIMTGLLSLSWTVRPASEIARVIFQAVLRTALIAGFEEAVFRGVFLRIFYQEWSDGIAALASAALWALLHLPVMVADGLSPWQIGVGMATFILWGIALAVGYFLGGRSLWLPFGMHWGYNITSSLLGGFARLDFSAEAWLIGHETWAPESGFIGLALWGLACLMLWRVLSRQKLVGLLR